MNYDNQIYKEQVDIICEKICKCRSAYPVENPDSVTFDNIVAEIPTVHGVHIITHGFDVGRFREILEQTTSLNLTAEQIKEITTVKKDNPTLLYFDDKSQPSDIIIGLQKYFDETSPEQLEKDWQELEQFNQYGPDMEECLELGRQHCMEMMKNEELGILIDKFNTYDKLRPELWNLLNKYVETHNIRPDEEFQDFMVKNDGDVALFFINEYGEPSMTYHTVKIEDLCDANDKEY